MKKLSLVVLILLLMLVITGCVPGDERFTVESPAGFGWGLWHGMIWFVTFFMGIFTGGQYTIYESVNTGWSYNFGFLIGLGLIFNSKLTIKKKKE